jgi:hypothetical protein
VFGRSEQEKSVGVVFEWIWICIMILATGILLFGHGGLFGPGGPFRRGNANNSGEEGSGGD